MRIRPHQNGKLIVVEIKSSLDRGATHQFSRKVVFSTRQTGMQVDRKLIVAPHAEERARELAVHLGIEVRTDVMAVR